MARAQRANGIATRERLIDCAERMFGSNGYEATSLRAIATDAMVDIATLKYHFADKPTLFGEVYRRGHLRFLEMLDPLLDRFDEASSTEAVEELLDDFVVAIHDFVEADLLFVRMTLFRMLEQSKDVIAIEEELQTVAIGNVERRFHRLAERGIIHAVDARALVVFLVSSFASWHITARFKPAWLGVPGLHTTAGRARSETFFLDLLTTWLLPK